MSNPEQLFPIHLKDVYDNNKELIVECSKKELQLAQKEQNFFKCLLLLHKKRNGLPFVRDKFEMTCIDNVTRRPKQVQVDFELFYSIHMATTSNDDQQDQSQLKAVESHSKTEDFESISQVSPDDQEDFMNDLDKEKLEFIEYSCSEEEVTAEYVHQSSETSTGAMAQGLQQDQKEIGIKKKSATADWTAKLDQYLLEYYGEHVDLYQKSNEVFWNKLSACMNSHVLLNNKKYTKTTVKERISILQAQYRKVRTHNDQTGNDPITCNNYDLMDELFCRKRWMEPVSLAGMKFDKSIEEDEPKNKKCRKSELFQELLEYRKARDDEKKAEREAKAELRNVKMQLYSEMLRKARKDNE